MFFGGFVRVADHQLEEESIELGFGKGVSAFKFKGVLGGDNPEEFGEGTGFAVEGDLLLFHGFEEGSLGFGRGAVDFVGEEEFGEDGSAFEGEGLGFEVEDIDAEDVGGEDIGGELDALEVGLNEAGKDTDKEGFSGAGDAFKDDVAAGEEGDEELINKGFLADDDLAEGFAQSIEFRHSYC